MNCLMRLQAEVYLFDIYIALSRLELQIYSCLAKTLFFITFESLIKVLST